MSIGISSVHQNNQLEILPKKISPNRHLKTAHKVQPPLSALNRQSDPILEQSDLGAGGTHFGRVYRV